MSENKQNWCPKCKENGAPTMRINDQGEYCIECVECYEFRTPWFPILQAAEEYWFILKNMVMKNQMKCEYCGVASWLGFMHKPNCPKGEEIEKRKIEELNQLIKCFGKESQAVAKLKCQNEEIRKAAREMGKIIKRLIKWDRDFPVGESTGSGLRELNKIIADGKNILEQTKEVNDGN